MITAKKATPSINAADTIMFERMSPLASGWRAIASMALAPILPIPIPAPIAANPAPKAAPNDSHLFAPIGYPMEVAGEDRPRLLSTCWSIGRPRTA